METIKLLCVRDAEALGKRMMTATGAYRRHLEHLLWVARHWPEHEAYLLERLHVVPEGLVRPMVRPDETAYCCLAWLLTGERSMAEQARERLLALADSVEVRERGEWTQTHTWCDAFPFGRWLILYDWVWDSGVFSEADHARLKERFLHYLWVHPYQRMKARPIELTSGNNQNAAMALACAVGGYLYGVKRGHDPRAGQLLEQAAPHLVEFVTAFPAGGYSYEGSTYMGAVNAYMLPLALEVAEAITGVDLFDSRAGETCASPREVFHAIMRLACPSGLTLPWDNYGYEPARFTSAAAYLAQRTGDDAALAFLDRQGSIERPSHSGWGFDQRLWTLLFWPQALHSTAADFDFNIAAPSLGAGMAGPEQRLFAYQMWDKCHFPPGRAQFNPNNLILEYDGAPLLVDGRAIELPKQEHFQLPKYSFMRPDTNVVSSFGGGTVGAHNCIFFDGEEEYAPHRSAEGCLLASDYVEGAALVEADVTDNYQPRYDVTVVRRATLVVGDELVVVRDRIVAESSHRVSWRAHLRGGDLAVEGGYAQLTAADRTRLQLCAIDGREWTHRRFEDSERITRSDGNLEGICHELTTTSEGRELDLMTVLVPSAGLAPWIPLQESLEWRWAADMEAAEALRRDWPGGEALDAARGGWFYTTNEHRPGVGVYRTRFTLEAEVPAGVVLRVPQLLRSSVVHVNDVAYPIEIGWEGNPLLPHLLAIGPSLRKGENTIDLLIPSTLEFSFFGRLELLAATAEAPRLRCERQEPSRLVVEALGRTWRIDWRDDVVLVQVDNDVELRLDPTAQRKLPPVVLKDAPAPTAATQLAHEAVARQAPMRPRPEADLLRDVRGSEWLVQLAALEEALHAPTQPLAEAALELLDWEMAHHDTLAKRAGDDICWYRLKAAAAHLLGAARCEAAVDRLGKLLLGKDFYPARVAAAQALSAIGTPAAREFLRQVSVSDEVNTWLTARKGLEQEV